MRHAIFANRVLNPAAVVQRVAAARMLDLVLQRFKGVEGPQEAAPLPLRDPLPTGDFVNAEDLAGVAAIAAR
ncbi:hypothetical protein D3C71_1635300 [compost metagenome]